MNKCNHSTTISLKSYIFSIIIPTYNGRDKISHLLESLLLQDFELKYEIIIVIDGSTDDTISILNHYPKDNLKIIVQENKGRANARNRGVQEAQGSILLFVDDDMRLGVDCLSRHYKHHIDTHNSTLVGKVNLDRKLLKKDFDFYIFHLLEKWELAYKGKTILQASNLKFTTQHLSIPSDVFNSIGGFDNRLTDGEDYDLGMRLIEANKTVYYDQKIEAWHDDFPTCARYIKRQIEYKRSHAALIDLGKKYIHGVFQPVDKPKNFLKKILIKILNLNIWVKFIDNQTLLFLPKTSRYRLYASIIYAHTISRI